MEKGKDMQRVHARLTIPANEWLDKRSEEIGVSKSSLIMMAVENYIRESRAMEGITDLAVLAENMGNLVKKFEELQETVQRNGLE